MLRATTYSTAGPGTRRIAIAVPRNTPYVEMDGTTRTMSRALTWTELEQKAPEIAARGRELLEKFQFVLVGTLTKDGSPRVTPVETYVIDGHLLANMMPRSLKALD